jgi:Co/Zn/Cd efflux system component
MKTSSARHSEKTAPCSAREGKQRHAARVHSTPPTRRKKSVKKKKAAQLKHEQKKLAQVTIQPETG